MTYLWPPGARSLCYRSVTYLWPPGALSPCCHSVTYLWPPGARSPSCRSVTHLWPPGARSPCCRSVSWRRLDRCGRYPSSLPPTRRIFHPPPGSLRSGYQHPVFPATGGEQGLWGVTSTQRSQLQEVSKGYEELQAPSVLSYRRWARVTRSYQHPAFQATRGEQGLRGVTSTQRSPLQEVSKSYEELPARSIPSYRRWARVMRCYQHEAYPATGGQ